MIETALVTASPRAGEAIFGRPLLERLLTSCERIGIKHFFIRATSGERSNLAESLGRFARQPQVRMVDSFEELLSGPEQIDPASPCLALNGNLVISSWSLRRIVSESEGQAGRTMTLLSADPERAGSIAIGLATELIRAGDAPIAPARTASYLPFALNGRPEDRGEAELRLARSLKQETADTDAFLARHVDRNLSWRISMRLAHVRGVTANRITLTNTAVGLLCAWMFASPWYWARLAGALLFLLSITIDGIDGEFARLTMTETKFGGMLDTITDNVVHVAVFAGIFTGCYRASASPAYLYLIPVVLIGFSLCMLATYRAFQVHGADAEEWMSKVDRISGRDFAYLLVLLAAINRLNYFAWGVAFGTYVFAFGLMWLTQKRWGRAEIDAAPDTNAAPAEEL